MVSITINLSTKSKFCFITVFKLMGNLIALDLKYHLYTLYSKIFLYIARQDLINKTHLKNLYGYGILAFDRQVEGSSLTDGVWSL